MGHAPPIFDHLAAVSLQPNACFIEGRSSAVAPVGVVEEIPALTWRTNLTEPPEDPDLISDFVSVPKLDRGFGFLVQMDGVSTISSLAVELLRCFTWLIHFSTSSDNPALQDWRKPRQRQ
jgi:hypothetical protein